MTQPKCKHCGRGSTVHHDGRFADYHTFEAGPARLTVEVVYRGPYCGGTEAWYWQVSLDGRSIGGAEWFRSATESEARAAAEAYVEDLVRHFREGGR